MNFEIDDIVIDDITRRKGIVINIVSGDQYPIRVKFGIQSRVSWYTINGEYYIDAGRVLTLEEIHENINLK